MAYFVPMKNTGLYINPSGTVTQPGANERVRKLPVGVFQPQPAPGRQPAPVETWLMSSGLWWLYRTRTSSFMLTSIRMAPPRGTRTLGDRGWTSARSVARDTTFSFAKFTG